MLRYVVLLLAWSTVIADTEPEWWQNAVFYQIYPKSFKDNNNDGFGDLPGIIEKLDYLKELGITSPWLSPIYESPQVDGGYDISDYRSIDKKYGTMEDFSQLIEKANKLGLKIVMDFVPNHSSNQHEWFKKSENREPGFEDYYIWRNGSESGKPPNNWISVFKYSAWTYSPVRKQFYLHQFTPEQPDLNFRNPKVVQEILDILTFWMDKGVYGFRVDAIPHLFEDPQFKDEPLSGKKEIANYEYDYLNHIYTVDQTETFEFVYKMRQHVDNYTSVHGGEPRLSLSRILMTEAYSPLESIKKYYGTKDKKGAHFSFNFMLITDLNVKSTAQDFADKINQWMNVISNEYTSNWVLGNHDNNRVATRYGKDNVDGLNMLLAILPGIGVTYNGEEIGMEDGEVTFEEGEDPRAKNGKKEDFSKVSRDFERTPFHWDNTVNAGFNTGAKPWLPVSKKYLENNLQAQKESDTPSHFKIYQNLMKIRQMDALKTGNFSITALAKNVIGIVRRKDSKPAILYVFNKGEINQKVNLLDTFKLNNQLKVLVSSENASKSIGQLIKINNSITLLPHEAFVAEEFS